MVKSPKTPPKARKAATARPRPAPAPSAAELSRMRTLLTQIEKSIDYGVKARDRLKAEIARVERGSVH